jgi:hypothetical protein
MAGREAAVAPLPAANAREVAARQVPRTCFERSHASHLL